MGAGENTQRTIRTIEILNGGDVDGYVANYAEDAVVHGLPPDFEPTRAGLRHFVGVTLNVLPDLQFSIEDVVAEDDRVAVRGRFAATHAGALSGAAPTRDQLGWEMTTILQFGADGRVVEQWIRDDASALLVQLGVVRQASTRPAFGRRECSTCDECD